MAGSPGEEKYMTVGNLALYRMSLKGAKWLGYIDLLYENVVLGIGEDEVEAEAPASRAEGRDGS